MVYINSFFNNFKDFLHYKKFRYWPNCRHHSFFSWHFGKLRLLHIPQLILRHFIITQHVFNHCSQTLSQFVIKINFLSKVTTRKTSLKLFKLPVTYKHLCCHLSGVKNLITPVSPLTKDSIYVFLRIVHFWSVGE